MEGISEERCGGRWSAGVDRGYRLRHLATKPSSAARFRLRAATPAARGCARRGGEGRFLLQPHQPLLEEGGIETLRDGRGDDDGRFRSGDEGGRFWRSLPATARHLLGRRQLEHRREGTLLNPLFFYFFFCSFTTKTLSLPTLQTLTITFIITIVFLIISRLIVGPPWPAAWQA